METQALPRLGACKLSAPSHLAAPPSPVIYPVGRPFTLAHRLPLVFLQGMGGNFIMALVAWLCGVGWCFTMCCWVPDPYGKQPRVAVTDMER